MNVPSSEPHAGRSGRGVGSGMLAARTRARTRFVLLALVLVLPFALADEIDASTPQDPVARLTVTPAGDQSFDLLTGETTLPDGGTIHDTETGLTLRAAWIAYVEGERIDAVDATAETEAGILTAPALRIDVPELSAVASEGVTFEREGITVRADAATLLFDPGLVRFEAPTAASLELQAVALLLDAASGDAVLIGPYRFQDGAFLLSDDREGSRLQLRPATTADGVPTYRAANEVDEDLWERLAPVR